MQQLMQIRLLGGFSITLGDAPVHSINTPRLQSLLAYLVLHRDAPQSRQHLAFLLWPDSSDTQAQTNLRNLVHRVRAALPQGEQYLLIDNHTLRWNSAAPFTLDVLEFETLIAQAAQAAKARDSALQLQLLDAAVALYNGDLLAEFYYDWIIPAREELSRKFVAALEALVSVLGDQERYSEALRHATRLKNYDPLRENTYRLLIELCGASGDVTAAMRYYQECSTVMERELNVSPSPITQRTYRRILQLASEQRHDNSPLPEPVVAKKRVGTNLPVLPNTFVGRSAELAAIDSLLAQPGVRLLTLVGAPGVGKTRLALQAAPALAERFPDGVYFVALAPVTNAALVIPTVANMLAVRERPNQPVLESLADWAADKQALLILDNFEHVLEATPEIARLLAAGERLKVLATSRSPLQLYGEHEFPVLPLEVPATREAAMLDLAQLGEYSALRLFKERAVAVQPAFTLNAENSVAVAAICRKLDALPLAIELAATRVKLLPPALLLARLEQRLDELASGARDLPDRHRTLRAAIEWSYNLLGEQEQQLFRSLSVFVGGCTVEAASYVSDHAGSAAEAGLLSLADKSLLTVTLSPGNVPRFSMLETIREFASSKLSQSGDESLIRERHATYYADWLGSRSELLAHATSESLETLNVEEGNMQAAVQWALTYGSPELSAMIGLGLWRYLFTRGRFTQGIRLMDSMLAVSHRLPPTVLARALPMAAAMADTTGDRARAARLLAEGVAISREVGDLETLADALRIQAFHTLLNKAFADAMAGATEAALLYKQLNHKLGLGACLLISGVIKIYQGNVGEGTESVESSTALFNELGDLQAVNFNLALQGHAFLWLGKYAQAEELLLRGMKISRQIDDNRNLADCILGLGIHAAASADYEKATLLFGAADALFNNVSAVVWPLHSELHQRVLSQTRAHLGAATFDAAWEKGQALTPDQAINVALGKPLHSSPSEQPGLKPPVSNCSE